MFPNKRLFLTVGLWIAALGVTSLPSPSARGQGVVESGLDRHAARLAANDADAEVWKAAHPSGVADEPNNAHDHGCPDGTSYWLRDRFAEICAPLCDSDADCAPEYGRCRILDTADKAPIPGVVFVDDLPAQEVEAWMAGSGVSAPVMLCDPFWDAEGATDAE